MCFEIQSTQQGIVMHQNMFQMANPPIDQEVSNDAARRPTSQRNSSGLRPPGTATCALGVLSRPATAPFESLDVRQTEDTMIDLSELFSSNWSCRSSRQNRFLTPRRPSSSAMNWIQKRGSRDGGITTAAVMGCSQHPVDYRVATARVVSGANSGHI